VARWTTLHVRRLEHAFTEALFKPGFAFEVISPCPTLYGRLNKQKSGLDQMQYYKQNSVIRHGADPRQADIGLTGQIVVGKLVDLDKPSYLQLQGMTG
jgi:2-oxoglutarate ferredoxin oxidoreductase subunit beta